MRRLPSLGLGIDEVRFDCEFRGANPPTVQAISKDGGAPIRIAN